MSFEYRYVGPWVISLVPSSCMSLLQLNVGTHASMIFTGKCWIICNFYFKIHITILTCEYHIFPSLLPTFSGIHQLFLAREKMKLERHEKGGLGTANYLLMAQLPMTRFWYLGG